MLMVGQILRERCRFMKVSIEIKEGVNPPYAVIYTQEITKAVKDGLTALTQASEKQVMGVKEEKVFLLDTKDIYYFYCEDKKVFCKTQKGVFKMKERLYALEAQMAHKGFVKLSAAILANVKMIDHFELNFKGSLRVIFKNGEDAFASRRYVSKIKEELGL